MKTKTWCIVLLVSGILVNSSCSGGNGGVVEEEEQQNASLILTINAANNNEFRASGRGVENSGSPTQTEENSILSCSAYVFYPNGALEKTVPITSSTQTIDGLTAGNRTIVVLANMPSGYGTITHYDQIADEMMDLDTQEPSLLLTCGLAMSGENSCTLVEGNSNQITIRVSRVVAKIAVGAITVSAATGHDYSLFQLVAVHIMKAKTEANMGVPTMITGSNFYGGVIGGVSTTSKSYLSEAIAEGETGRYFYVFPNDNADGNATMLTIEGEYDGVTTYFSFYINNEVSSIGNDGTGEYIKRNTLHTVNVTLKKLDGGSDDPEQPADPASMDVTIVAEDWIDIPAQSVEW